MNLPHYDTDEGNPPLNRLCIMALQESDLNQCNRLAIGRPILHSIEDANDMPNMQYGSQLAKQCISTVLNKVPQLEIQRYYKHPLAYIENEAVGCYDKIMNPLILLALRQLGIPHEVLTSLAETWAHMMHRIKMIYGISDQFYTNTVGYFLYGPGQGFTIGPILWLLCFLLIY